MIDFMKFLFEGLVYSLAVTVFGVLIALSWVGIGCALIVHDIKRFILIKTVCS